MPTGQGGRCQAHQPDRATRLYDRDRGSSNQRGYDHTWRKFRIRYLSDNALCIDCSRTLATEIHHIIKLKVAPDRQYILGNLMALCKPCHAIRTARGE